MPRRNLRPVFIVAFTRGGSNILLNLLRSHPDLVGTRGELQQVFRGRPDDDRGTLLAKRLLAWLPMALAERAHVVRPADWHERPPLSPLGALALDRGLWRDRLRARHPSENLWRTEGVRYTDAEIRGARLLVKNVDGLIFLSRALAEIYPDATFVALVRNGYAVCEGQHRRGIPLEDAANRYATGVARMLEDAERLPRYRLVRYEDLIDPNRSTLEELMDFCELDPAKLSRVRLETKPVVGADGTHPAGAGGKRTVWYDVAERFEHFVPTANANQIARLDAVQRETIRARCAAALERFGYDART